MQTKIIIGVLIILIGVSSLLDQVNLFPWFRIGNVWPVFLVVGGLALLMQKKIFEGVLVAMLGVSFLLSNIFDYNFFSIFWPLVIVGVGIFIIFKPKLKNNNASGDSINETLAFSGADKRIISQDFTGGKIECFCAGYKLDLRGAKISQKGAVLDISAVFGGVEIIVDQDMRVESSGSAVFGGWENKVLGKTDTTLPLLKITGNAIFGGVEIK